MKKIIGTALFCLLAAALVLLVLFSANQRQQKLGSFEKSCANRGSSQFASERAHAVLIQNRTLASVRLSGEKNFSPPGGHIEQGETPQVALLRELKEELGIALNQSSLKPYKTYCELLGATKTQRTFTYLIDSWEAFVIPNSTQVKWVTSEFSQDVDADTELVKLLELLKADNYID